MTVKYASSPLRRNERPSQRKRFLAVCCEIVEAPAHARDEEEATTRSCGRANADAGESYGGCCRATSALPLIRYQRRGRAPRAWPLSDLRECPPCAHARQPWVPRRCRIAQSPSAAFPYTSTCVVLW